MKRSELLIFVAINLIGVTIFSVAPLKTAGICPTGCDLSTCWFFVGTGGVPTSYKEYSPAVANDAKGGNKAHILVGNTLTAKTQVKTDWRVVGTQSTTCTALVAGDIGLCTSGANSGDWSSTTLNTECGAAGS